MTERVCYLSSSTCIQKPLFWYVFKLLLSKEAWKIVSLEVWVRWRGWWDGYLHNLPLSVSIVAALCKSSLNEDIVVVHIIIVNVSWQQHIIKSKLQPTSNKIVTMCIDHKKPRTKNEGPLFQKISLRFIGEVYFSGHLQVWSLKKGLPKRMDCVKWGD